MMEQGTLLEIPEQPERPAEAEGAARETARPRQLKLRVADRSQLLLTAIELDRILPGNHPARAIVALLERVDTTAFTAGIRTWQGQAGRSERDPKTMIAVILYAYTEGIGSMREVARLTAHEPALRWITGLDEISHTELSEFRRQHQAALAGLFAQLLAVLDQAQVINLDQVATDGTRIRTFAGMDTFRRRGTIEQRLAQARKLVQDLESGAASEPAGQRKHQAQRELIERLEASQRELAQMSGDQEGSEKPETRVSMTEPEARMMRASQGGYVSAYNVQLAAESAHKVIVSLAVSNVGTDGVHLEGTLEQIKATLGKYPKQALVDTAYVTQSNLTKAHDRQVELVGPLPDSTVHTTAGLAKTGIDVAFAPQFFVWDEPRKAFLCPAGKPLAYWKKHVKDRERVYDWYQAKAADCAACPHRIGCVQTKRRTKGLGRCLQVQRPHPLVEAHRKKMETPAAKAAYRKRGEVAEFPNAWLKEKIGLRKFRLRGLVKAKIEVTWACLAYNVAIWRRLLWQPA